MPTSDFFPFCLRSFGPAFPPHSLAHHPSRLFLYQSASIILAFALYALGEFSQSLAILANCNFEIPTPSAPHIERYDFTLLVLGHTISGTFQP